MASTCIALISPPETEEQQPHQRQKNLCHKPSIIFYNTNVSISGKQQLYMIETMLMLTVSINALYFLLEANYSLNKSIRFTLAATLSLDLMSVHFTPTASDTACQ